MKIKIEVKNAELEEMGCDTVGQFEKHIRNHIDNGVSSDDGEAGVDWMCEYQLEIVVIN